MRALNRVASALLGIVLIVVGLVAAAEAVAAYRDQRPLLLPLRQWYDRLIATTFADRGVLLISIGAGVLGLLVLVSQLRRWQPRELDLRSEENMRWQLRRHSLQQQVAASVSTVPGVQEPQVDVAGRQSAWSVRVRAAGRPDQLNDVRSAARSALTRLDVPDTVGLQVDLITPKRVS
jgi:hypothetical protein